MVNANQLSSNRGGGVANGKSETCQDVETGILKSESETKKCGDLIEKQICDRQTENQRFRDPLVGCARFRDLGRICRDFYFSEDHSPPLTGEGFGKKVLKKFLPRDYYNSPSLSLRF